MAPQHVLGSCRRAVGRRREAALADCTALILPVIVPVGLRCIPQGGAGVAGGVQQEADQAQRAHGGEAVVARGDLRVGVFGGRVCESVVA